MRERYFCMYESIKFKECFYTAHGIRASRLYNLFSILTIVLSIFSVLVWSIAKSMPALWAIIIAVAQLAQAFSIRLPWFHQLSALKYLTPELKKLSLNIDHDWLSLDVDSYDDKKILELISKYESDFSELEEQFTRDAEFPEIESVLKDAEKYQRAYFYSKYPKTERCERSEAYAG